MAKQCLPSGRCYAARFKGQDTGEDKNQLLEYARVYSKGVKVKTIFEVSSTAKELYGPEKSSEVFHFGRQYKKMGKSHIDLSLFSRLIRAFELVGFSILNIPYRILPSKFHSFDERIHILFKEVARGKEKVVHYIPADEIFEKLGAKMKSSRLGNNFKNIILEYLFLFEVKLGNELKSGLLTGQGPITFEQLCEKAGSCQEILKKISNNNIAEFTTIRWACLAKDSAKHQVCFTWLDERSSTSNLLSGRSMAQISLFETIGIDQISVILNSSGVREMSDNLQNKVKNFFGESVKSSYDI